MFILFFIKNSTACKCKLKVLKSYHKWRQKMFQCTPGWDREGKCLLVWVEISIIALSNSLDLFSWIIVNKTKSKSNPLISGCKREKIKHKLSLSFCEQPILQDTPSKKKKYLKLCLYFSQISTLGIFSLKFCKVLTEMFYNKNIVQTFYLISAHH